MKKYKKHRIIALSTKLSDFFFKSKQNLLRDILQNNWEIFLSTYQSNKKKIPFGYSSMPFGTSVDLQKQRDHRYLVLLGSKGIAQLSPRQESSKSFLPASSIPPFGIQRTPVAGRSLESPGLVVPMVSRRNFTGSKKHKVSRGILRTKSTNFFYFKKENFFHLNYLSLAKLVDLLGDAQSVQNRIRKLIKIHSKHLELETLFQINLFKNSFFFRWVSYLLIDQIYQFIKRTSSFLCKFQLMSPFGPVWKNKTKLDIQNNVNFLFLNCQDFLLLKWYQNKISAWFYQVVAKTKETKMIQNSNRIRTHNNISCVLESSKKSIYYPQDEISSPHQIFKKKKWLEKKMKNLSLLGSFVPSLGSTKRETSAWTKPEAGSLGIHRTKGSKQRYLKLIKNILRKSKVKTQGELIQKLNNMIGNWDTFIINNITKRNAIKLNLLLYQLLWHWGLARHRKQKAKWIKNRYWSLCTLQRSTRASQ